MVYLQVQVSWIHQTVVVGNQRLQMEVPMYAIPRYPCPLGLCFEHFNMRKSCAAEVAQHTLMMLDPRQSSHVKDNGSSKTCDDKSRTVLMYHQ